jgi:cathepsin A (carboxypeptidase C)
MRVSTSSTLLLGAASSVAALQDQVVLGGQQDDQPSIDFGTEAPTTEKWWDPLEKVWGKASAEMTAAWDELSMIMPETMEDAVSQVKALANKSKQGTRRPDSIWDFHVKGAEIGDIVTQVDGQTQPVHGDFSNYALRAKHVDPSQLGVDTVKQYSGYLDANEEDKHLFFCKSATFRLHLNNVTVWLTSSFYQGSSSLAMTPRTIPLSFGSMVDPDAPP